MFLSLNYEIIILKKYHLNEIQHVNDDVTTSRDQSLMKEFASRMYTIVQTRPPNLKYGEALKSVKAYSRPTTPTKTQPRIIYILESKDTRT